MTSPIRIGLFGAAPDTSNMGVSALCYALIDAMATRLPDCEFVIFDNGLGRRDSSYPQADRAVHIIGYGARGGMRYHRPENLATMSALANYPLAARFHPGIALIDSCDVIMDVSGGDSFSDIYGNGRFRNMLLPKRIAVQRGRPLLLLPQTYGPYTTRRCRELARAALQAADEVWARDRRSFEVMQGLLGRSFDPDNHRLGVDMAFGLSARAPRNPNNPIAGLIRDCEQPLVGFNVSGLIWNAAMRGGGFGFKADYAAVVEAFLLGLLQQTNARVLLIPHVHTAPGSDESDAAACLAVQALLARRAELASRCTVVSEALDPRELKWIIAQCDWFCGTRMHATIAALSSGVPTASIVYSDKAGGVFESCGQADGIIDPRVTGTDESVRLLQAHFHDRMRVRASVAAGMKQVRAVLEMQMDAIADFARGNAVTVRAVG